MIAYKYRFHGHGSLRYLYTKGKAVRSGLLQVKYVRNDRRQDSRVTVIVGKKVAKSAVKRNRIRRRIYEIVRRNWNGIASPYDFAITVFSVDFVDMPADRLEMSVLDVLKQAAIYKS